MADWSPSEFSRLRAQYAWDDARDSGDTDEQWLLQYIYSPRRARRAQVLRSAP